MTQLSLRLDYLSGTRTQEPRGSVDEDGRQKKVIREDSLTSQSPRTDGGPSSATEGRNPLGAIGNEGSAAKPKEEKDFQDPLDGMAEADKWGMKGLRTLMNNYPDYNALIYGIDPSSFNLDLTSNE